MKHYYDILAKTFTTPGNSTGTITATLVGNVTGNVTGNLTGNVTGNVTGAVTGAATQVTVADESSDTSCFPVFVTAATGDLAPKSAAGLTFNASTDTLAATAFSGPLTGNVTGDIQGAALTTEKGSGMAGLTAYATTCTKSGKIVTTHIYLDIEGIVSKNTANDIIGDDDAANAHIGRITVADCGQLISGSITCLEAPTGGDNDIDFYSATESTGAEDAAIGGLTETLLLNSGDWTLGLSQALTALPAANEYLYMVAATGDLAAAYTAGKFLVELVGYEA